MGRTRRTVSTLILPPMAVTAAAAALRTFLSLLEPAVSMTGKADTRWGSAIVMQLLARDSKALQALVAARASAPLASQGSLLGQRRTHALSQLGFSLDGLNKRGGIAISDLQGLEQGGEALHVNTFSTHCKKGKL